LAHAPASAGWLLASVLALPPLPKDPPFPFAPPPELPTVPARPPLPGLPPVPPAPPPLELLLQPVVAIVEASTTAQPSPISLFRMRPLKNTVDWGAFL
jgi:hypothetical protein